ncbi:MAG: hypothetical protein QF828_05720, partial [Pseudomonadales bacterium]|nr:hypothetical protein [Pseudomonadales bacterium]
KAPPGTEPSREASIGRFLYSESFLEALADGWTHHTGGGEYYHVDGLKRQMEQRGVVYCRFTGARLDMGTPEGFLRALIRHAGDNPFYREILREEISRLPPETT